MLHPRHFSREFVRRLAAGAVLVVATGVETSRASEYTVTPLFIAGGRGNDPGEFGIPESVVLDGKGQVAVTDKGRMMVHVYSRLDGVALFSVGQLGSALGDLNRPNGIAVDSQGRVLVVEQRNYRVQIFDADYRSLGSFGYQGGGDGGFQKPMGIAIDSQDRIYVTDESRGDVQVFSPAGDFLWSFAKTDPRLRRVESIEVDEDSRRIFVCDEGRSRVNVYDLQGNFLESFGEQGTGPGQFGNDPNAVRVDGRGRVWINDQGNTRINVYAADLQFLASFRNAANGMESADGMELSEELNLLLVADQGNDRVLAFDLMQLQVILEWLELQSPAQQVSALTAHSDPNATGMHHPLWETTRLTLRAEGQGAATAIDTALARVASAQDERGLIVPLIETHATSGIFLGTVQLGDRTDAATGTLAAASGDTVRAHLAGGPWTVAEPVLPLPPPEIRDLDVGPGTVPLLHRDPRLTWSFHDPAHRRLQEAVEITLWDAQGAMTWSSGEVPGPAESYTLTDAALPAATARLARVRVRTGDLWSTAAELHLQRNTPPPLPQRVSPQPNSILHEWPPVLRIHGLTDPDGHALRVHFEFRTPAGKQLRSATLDVSHEPWLEWTPGDYNVMENETLEWRVVTDDGIEITIGPWWSAHRDEIADLPNLPELTGPQDGAWQHEDRILLQWTAIRDPDPLQQPNVQLQWRRSDDRIWHEEPLPRTTRHAWQGPQRDGAIEWRLRITDDTGIEQLTPIRSLRLDRNWSMTLRVTDGSTLSEPLTIGMRAGARDATIPGEDVPAPDGPGGPEIFSVSAPNDAERPLLGFHRLVDLRRPTSPTNSKRQTAYDILVRGRPRQSVEILLSDLDLPVHRTLVWRRDDDEDLPLPPDRPMRLQLDAQGEARGRILFETRQKDEHEPGQRRRERFADVTANGTDARAVSMNGRAATLRQHLQWLPNPLDSHVRLLPAHLHGPITVSVYDVRGRLLQSWVGRTPDLTAFDVFGRARLPTGIYLVRAHVGSEAAQRKLVWIRP